MTDGERIATAILDAFSTPGGLLEDSCVTDGLMSISQSLRGEGRESDRSVTDALFAIAFAVNGDPNRPHARPTLIDALNHIADGLYSISAALEDKKDA